MKSRILLGFIALMIAFNAIIIIGPTIYDRMTGEVVTTVNITESTILNCSYTLGSGWSLISFSCIGTQDNPETLLDDLTTMNGIFRYVPSDTQDPWKSYNRRLPSWVVNDLSYMSKTHGYWIRMGSTQQFFHEGTISDESTISTVAGWNLIGYPSDKYRATNTTFSTAFGYYNRIEAYNNTNETWYFFDPYSTNSTLNYTEPFLGYWINMTSPRTITITG